MYDLRFVLVWVFFVAVINAITISNLGRKVLISAFGWSPTRMEVRAGSLEAEIEGLDAEAKEKHC